MGFISRKMDEMTARNILNWKYDEPYDFYNNELTDENVHEMLDGSYHSIVNEHNELIGFYCIGENARVPSGSYNEDHIDIGLGMNPSLTGKGNGYNFCTFIILKLEVQFDKPLRLTVATFNERAIKLYKKLGFVKEYKFNSKVTEFITMIKE